MVKVRSAGRGSGPQGIGNEGIRLIIVHYLTSPHGLAKWHRLTCLRLVSVPHTSWASPPSDVFCSHEFTSVSRSGGRSRSPTSPRVIFSWHLSSPLDLSFSVHGYADPDITVSQWELNCYVYIMNRLSPNNSSESSTLISLLPSVRSLFLHQHYLLQLLHW